MVCSTVPLSLHINAIRERHVERLKARSVRLSTGTGPVRENGEPGTGVRVLVGR